MHLQHVTMTDRHLVTHAALLTCAVSPTQILLFDQENFQGRMVEVQNECMNVCDHGMDRVRSIIVESGP